MWVRFMSLLEEDLNKSPKRLEAERDNAVRQAKASGATRSPVRRAWKWPGLRG